VRLHAEIHPSQQRWQLGYRRRKAHTIVPFSTCITLIPPLKHALPIFFEHWQHHIPPELKSAQIHWAATPAGTLAFAIVPTIPTGFPQWQSALKRLLAALTPELPGLQGCLFTSQHHIHRQGSPMLQYPHPASQPLFFEPSAFTQATPLVNNQLIACIQHHIQTLTPQHVVELFAGIGNLTLAVAETGVPIAAYENHPLSSHWHRQNLQPLAHATFFQKAATAAFPLPPHTELLILDPPRKGAAAELTLLSSSAHRPPAILYISCHAATLARDARLLHSLGYTPTDIRCFDMFPHTPHVEICALFQ
jgi:23S rRNA (uracil1939-C5)-methyltransferase